MAQVKPRVDSSQDLKDDADTVSAPSTDLEDISLRAVDRATEKYSSLEHERHALRMNRAIARGQAS